MSYYILPKNINIIEVNPTSSHNVCSHYITFSLLNFYSQIKKQIIDMFMNDYDLSDNSFDEAIRIINPYEFIFSKVPGSKFSVSKLKPKTNIFYDLLEIFNNLNVLDSLKEIKFIQTLHISPNFEDSIECFGIYREECNDSHIYYENIDMDNHNLKEMKADFIFYETDIKNYFYSCIQSIITILGNQNYNGSCVIKIGHVFNKPVVDMLYFLTSLYDKVYISKPSTNNITSFDRYIVCKNFQFNELDNSYLKFNYFKLIIFLKKLENKHISNILDIDLPYYFKSKIDDLNIIIGQQQLEALDQIITIYKNKNKNDKIENIKKNNIQKSVLWCEKYKIPCNKFSEKINIFLPIINESI
jgi:hypothetical protein